MSGKQAMFRNLSKTNSNDLKYRTGNQTKFDFAEMRMPNLAYSKISDFTKVKTKAYSCSKKVQIYGEEMQAQAHTPTTTAIAKVSKNE